MLKNELIKTTKCHYFIFGLLGSQKGLENKQAILLRVSEQVPLWDVMALVLDIQELARVGGGLALKWVCCSANYRR